MTLVGIGTTLKGWWSYRSVNMFEGKGVDFVGFFLGKSDVTTLKNHKFKHMNSNLSTFIIDGVGYLRYKCRVSYIYIYITLLK